MKITTLGIKGKLHKREFKYMSLDSDHQSSIRIELENGNIFDIVDAGDGLNIRVAGNLIAMPRSDNKITLKVAK